MGGLIGGSTTISTTAEKVSGLRIQTSAIGKAIPIVYGTTRIASNIIWYDDFNAISHTSTQSSGGGKGGGGVTQTSTTYTYEASLIFGLCEGQVSGIGTIWKDKKIITLAESGLTFFNGSSTQSPWGFLTSNHPTKAIGYQNTAYVASAQFPLSESAQLSNMSFEINGFYSTSTDASPADIITDLLTNSAHGAGFNASWIADLSNYRAYCTAYGLNLSIALESQKGASDWVKDICKSTNSEAIWSEGKLKIIPYGDTSSGAFVPQTTPIYDLNDDDFCDKYEPLKVTRSTPADAFNQIQIEFINRSNQYNAETSESKDLANIELFGLRPSEVIQAHSICDPVAAKQLAQLILQRTLYVRNTFQFTLSWKYALLEPMDVVTITDASMGFNKKQVRITSIDEDSDGLLSIEAEEFISGISTATLYPKQDASATVIDYAVTPPSVNIPVFFDPPSQLVASSKPEVWCAVSGGQYWGGCEIWSSNDGTSYRFMMSALSPARTGVVVTDNGTTIDIDLTESLSDIISVTAAESEAYATLSYVGGELIAYTTATLTASHKYTLGGLYRGIYGTPTTTHASGEKFAKLDPVVLKIPVTTDMIGRTLYTKFLSYNIYGQRKEDISSVSAYTHLINGGSYIVPVSITEHPTWAGTKTQVVLNGATIELDRDTLGDVYATGSYICANSITLPSAKTASLNMNIQYGAYDTATLAQVAPSLYSVTVDISIDSGAYAPFTSGDYYGTTFAFQINLNSTAVNVDTYVSSFSVSATAPI